MAGDAIERVVDRYEALMHRLIEGHAPEFTEVGVTMAQAKVLYVLAADVPTPSRVASSDMRSSPAAART